MRVYTASKLHHATKWRELRAAWPEVEFTASWPLIDVREMAESDQDISLCVQGWIGNLDDVTRSDVVLVYAEPADHLRGALVEAGMALSLGRKVIVVGEHSDYGTWQYHPGVHRVADMDAARRLLTTL